MAYTTNAAEHLCDDDAANDEIDQIFYYYYYFCNTFKDREKKKPVMRYTDFG